MSQATYLNNFPRHVRGTYRLKGDEDGGESKKLIFAKDLIKSIAVEAEITILLHCEMQGNGWLLLWWPANEPRHQATDQIITPGENDG